MRFDVLAISQALLGKFLVTKINSKTITSGMIVETEAYMGPEDKASHAYGNRRSKRTETMYAMGGHAYVYLCYGMHHLFNIVTATENIPHAILIRAIEPCDGIDLMLKRRNMSKAKYGPNLTAGPGTLTQALGIKVIHDRADLCGKQIWLEDRGVKIAASDVVTSPRIGIAYAKEHAELPWRFTIRGNAWVSNNKVSCIANY